MAARKVPPGFRPLRKSSHALPSARRGRSPVSREFRHQVSSPRAFIPWTLALPRAHSSSVSPACFCEEFFIRSKRHPGRVLFILRPDTAIGHRSRYWR